MVFEYWVVLHGLDGKPDYSWRPQGPYRGRKGAEKYVRALHAVERPWRDYRVVRFKETGRKPWV